MSNLKAEMGSRIAKIRKEHGDTQAITADKLGIKRGTLAAYELGSSAMPDEIKSKFVSIYNITYEYLIVGESHQVVAEPPSEYQKRDVISLINQLPANSLTDEVKRKVVTLIHQNNELKDKVITLLEEKDELMKKLNE